MIRVPLVRGEAMQAIAGLVMTVNMAIALIVAIRLLRLGARTRGPERWLGVYFLFMWFLGFLLASAIYLGWSDARLALPEPWRAPLHGLYIAASSFGLYGIAVFTQRVFRPTSALARHAVTAAGIVLVFAWVAFGLTEGFAVAIVNGWAYWLGFAVRELAIVWLAIESLQYWTQVRRRLHVGLADPIVVNRFLLWGIWAIAVSIMQMTDPASRLWYWWITGDAVTYHVEIGRRVTLTTLSATALLGIVAASTLLLTFFPTIAYRRWLLARHAA
jgi:hypothetical protein